MFRSLPIGTRGTAAAIDARIEPLPVQLDEEEFAAYVLALRNFWRAAVGDSRSEEYRCRMHALDILHAVKDHVHADSVDTAHLRACWESRRYAASFDETYTLVLYKRAMRTIVYALAEYGASEPEDAAGVTFRAVAKALLERIDRMVR